MATTNTYYISCNDGIMITTTMTARASDVEHWISQIDSRFSGRHPSGVVVGLDVEWRPNRLTTDDNPVALLQLCVDASCLIIQLCHLAVIPRSLKSFLSNPRYVFVGVGVVRDVNKLLQDYDLECSRSSDVRALAVAHWPGMFSSRQPGLGEIASKLVGISLQKRQRVTLSNWERVDLMYEQVEYACLDAYASSKIGVRLVSLLGDGAL